MRHSMAGAIFLTGAFVQPVMADWQYTKWGMSLNELLAIQGVEFIKTTPKEKADEAIKGWGDSLAKADYATSKLQFVASFYFDDDALTAVRLKPRTLDDAIQAMHLLDAQYGKPEVSEDIRKYDGDCWELVRKWRVLSDGNIVSFNAYHCVERAPFNGLWFSSISYRPIQTETGL